MPSKEFIKTYRIKTGVIIREVASTRQDDNKRSSTFQIDIQRNGRRIRETLETLTKAEARCEEVVSDMKSEGVKMLALKDEKKYLEAMKRYESFPTAESFTGAQKLFTAFPTSKAQDNIVEAQSLMASANYSETFVDLVLFWAKHHPRGGLMPNVRTALNDYLEHKKNRRKGTLKQIRFEVGRFADFLETQTKAPTLSDVANATIEKYLKTKFPDSVRQQKATGGILRTFFKYCCTKYKLPENPAEGILLQIDARDETEVEAYTVDEVSSIMAAAMNHKVYACVTPSFAVGLFAGLRPTEAIGLDWKDVCFKTKRIRVSPETAKRRRSRLVDISENLIEWLKPHAQDSGKIISSIMTYRRAKEAIFKDAEVKSINDGFRHSFGTYHLALHEDANKTANQMGHRGNTDLVFSHYRKLVPKEDGKAFFEITPSSVKEIEK